MGSARMTIIAIASLGTLMGACFEEVPEPGATTERCRPQRTGGAAGRHGAR